jgi:hypothetical protein
MLKKSAFIAVIAWWPGELISAAIEVGRFNP